MAPSTQTPTLTAHLDSIYPTSKFPTRTQLLQSVLPSLLHSLPKISAALQRTSVTEAGSNNDFGDAQLNVDVLAEDILREVCAGCESVVSVSSEEDPVEKPARREEKERGSADGTDEAKEQYTIAFDPLDGSSIIGPNWSVGTIIGIWDGPSALSSTSTPREKQIGAILGVLGPRTCAVVALRLEGAQDVCFEVALGPDGTAEVTRPEVRLKDSKDVKTRYFAPANLRAASELPAYLSLINSYIAQRYTLRYSGGLVPDIFHALVKGHGIYISPVTEGCPAKLRRLYELAPVALMVECAGGEALDSRDGSRVLDRAVGGTDERGGLVCGSREDVEEVKGKLLEK